MMHKQPTVCCFRLDALGDLINTTPALTQLRQHWPDHHIVLITPPHNTEVFANSPLVDKIIAHPRKASLLQNLKLIHRLRQLKPSCAIIFSPKTRAFSLGHLSGAKQRIGLTLKDGGWFKRMLNSRLLTQQLSYDRHQAHLSGGPEAHHAATCLRLVALAGATLTNPPLSLPDTPKHRTAYQQLLSPLPRPITLCHLDERWALSPWTTAQIIQFIQHLGATLPGTLLLTTDVNSGPISQALQTRYPVLTPAARKSQIHIPASPLLSLKPCFADWQALIQNADQVITPECGCVHVAAAWQIPTLVLISEHLLPGKYAEWHPWQNAHRMVALNNDFSANLTTIDKALSDDIFQTQSLKPLPS